MSSTTADSYVAKVKLNGKTFPISPTLKGTCDTAANTVMKVVTLPDFDIPIDGSDVTVKFTYSNTAANPMLKVNNTDPYPIYTYGTTPPGNAPDTSWYAGSVITFMFDSSSNAWRMKDWSSAGSGSGDNDKVRQTQVPDDGGTSGETTYPLLLAHSQYPDEEDVDLAYKSENLIYDPGDGGRLYVGNLAMSSWYDDSEDKNYVNVSSNLGTFGDSPYNSLSRLAEDTDTINRSLESLIWGVKEGYYTFDSDNTGDISMTGELECNSLSVDGYFTAGGTSVYDLSVSTSATINGDLSTDQDLSVTGYSTFAHQIEVPDIISSEDHWDPDNTFSSLHSAIDDIYSKISSAPSGDSDEVRQVPITYDAEVGEISYPLLTGYTTGSLEETNYAHKTNCIRGGVNEYGTYLEVFDDPNFSHSLRITGNDITSSGYIGGGFTALSQMARTLGYLTGISAADENDLLYFDFTEDEDHHLVGTTMKIEGDITPMSGYWDSQDKYKSLVDMAEDLANMSGGGGSSILDNYITVNTSNHTINYPSGYAVAIGDVSIYPDTGDIYPTSGTWGNSNYDSLIGMADDLQSVVGAADLAYAMDNDKIYVDTGTGAITVQNTTQAVTVSRTDITKNTYWNTTDQIASLQATIDDLYSKIAALESRLPAQS